MKRKRFMEERIIAYHLASALLAVASPQHETCPS